MSLNVVDISDYKDPPEPAEGWYKLEVVGAKATVNGSIYMRLKIIEDFTGLNEDIDIEGRQLSTFFQLDASNCTEPWQREKVQRQVSILKNIFGASLEGEIEPGDEIEELIGVEVKTLVINKPDKHGIKTLTLKSADSRCWEEV